ncbi:MAG TPA: hypothetical protein VGE31_01615 [Candidatus Paceibacterota bacterium]
MAPDQKSPSEERLFDRFFVKRAILYILVVSGLLAGYRYFDTYMAAHM